MLVYNGPNPALSGTHYAVSGAFITPAGLRDAETAIGMFGTLTGEVIGAMHAEDKGAIEAEYEVLPDKPHGCSGNCGGDCGGCQRETQVITPEDVGHVEDIL